MCACMGIQDNRVNMTVTMVYHGVVDCNMCENISNLRVTMSKILVLK